MSTTDPTPKALETARDVRVELVRIGMEGNGVQLPAGTLAVIARALDAFAQAAVQKERERFCSAIREMLAQRQRQHDYSQGMSGGYGNPILAVHLMKWIEEMVKP